MNKLTKEEKDLVLEALSYYRDDATQPEEETCGIWGKKREIMDKATEKIRKWI